MIDNILEIYSDDGLELEFMLCGKYLGIGSIDKDMGKHFDQAVDSYISLTKALIKNPSDERTKRILEKALAELLIIKLGMTSHHDVLVKFQVAMKVLMDNSLIPSDIRAQYNEYTKIAIVGKGLWEWVVRSSRMMVLKDVIIERKLPVKYANIVYGLQAAMDLQSCLYNDPMFKIMLSLPIPELSEWQKEMVTAIAEGNRQYRLLGSQLDLVNRRPNITLKEAIDALTAPPEVLDTPNPVVTVRAIKIEELELEREYKLAEQRAKLAKAELKESTDKLKGTVSKAISEVDTETVTKVGIRVASLALFGIAV